MCARKFPKLLRSDAVGGCLNFVFISTHLMLQKDFHRRKFIVANLEMRGVNKS